MRRQPGAIAAAHADMEQTLLAVGAAHDLYLQAQQRLTAELERLWWRSVRRRVEACIARNGPPQSGGPGRPGGPGGSVGPPVDPPPDPAPASLLVRLSRRAVPWASTVPAAFAAAGQRK